MAGPWIDAMRSRSDPFPGLTYGSSVVPALPYDTSELCVGDRQGWTRGDHLSNVP
jgi:hypothetical protein